MDATLHSAFRGFFRGFSTRVSSIALSPDAKACHPLYPKNARSLSYDLNLSTPNASRRSPRARAALVRRRLKVLAVHNRWPKIARTSRSNRSRRQRINSVASQARGGHCGPPRTARRVISCFLLLFCSSRLLNGIDDGNGFILKGWPEGYMLFVHHNGTRRDKYLYGERDTSVS